MRCVVCSVRHMSSRFGMILRKKYASDHVYTEFVYTKYDGKT